MAQNIRLEGAPLRASDPAVGGVAINYSGGNQVLAVEGRGVYIGTTGHLAVIMRNGSEVTFSNLAAGQVYWFAIHTIKQTGSTAAGVVLL
jgi:hypothetical protein